jgi:hypothetical protein
MTNRNQIRNIGSYNTIRLGKRYEDGEFHTINFQRRDFGFDIFRTGMYVTDGQEYVGHKNFGEAYSYLVGSYEAGYKVVERSK